MRALCRDKNTAKWSLSDETEVNASEDAIFTHVEWSSSGLDLVIADQYGRFTLFSSTHALNSLERRPVNLTSSVDDLNQVVGLHWLALNSAGQRVSWMSMCWLWTCCLTLYLRLLYFIPLQKRVTDG